MPGTRTALSVVVVAAAVLAGSLGAAGAAAAEGAPSDRPVPGGQPTALLVKTAPAVDVAQLASEVGGVHTGRVGTSGVQRLSVPPSRIDGARRALAARPDVVGVEIDHVVTAARVPNDPFFPSQWGTVKVGAPDAWDVTIGTASTVVAVLDTGVSPQSDLRVLPGYDFVNRDADPADDHGHGTSAASIIAAQFDNGLAMSGVCGRCAVLPVKVLGRDGSGSYSAIISGIDYAVAQGADVLNLSLTGDVYSSFLADAVANARARGVVVVASAGNAGQTAMTYPAGLPGVLAVGATDEADRRTSYSNHGSWVTVAAPGRNVALNHVGDGVWFTGTSSSAPVVAGVVGLLRSHAPGASGAAVENAVTSSAVPIGSWVKHGRIDAVGALRALDSSLAFRPSAPTGVGGTAGDGAVQVSWTAAADRGSAITRYSVTSLPGGRTCATSGAVTCTVAGLTNGTAYTFSVTASNAVGTSDASSASAAVTPVAAVAPAAPAAPTATAGDGSAAVSWTAPADGGSPITGYTVTSSPDGKSCTTTGALSCVVGRLTNGTAYTFTVTATNAVGTSPASASSSAVTPVAPATAPAAPAAPTATAGDGSAAVSWTAPADGGSPITAYTATSRPQGKTCTTSGVTSCTVSGLANSTAYTFTVTATNAVGTSPASAPSNTVTPVGPATAPAAPAAPTATAGDGSAAVSWTAPADGGSPITGY
ncbi:MAG TPA: fibronectin type III domain-containing protein, partial [Mycobacteriales bacterium]|nr:fibronectin type III domain-containing protein [Mycobacteriales bacterium]